MSAGKGRRARRLAGVPVPAAMVVLARGHAVSMSRPELEPVVTEMVLAWWYPSLSKQTVRALPGIVRVLGWLAGQPGEDWQARWVASGADSQPRTWPSLIGAMTITEKQAAGLIVKALMILRAIAPSLPWLLGVSRFRLQDPLDSSSRRRRVHRAAKEAQSRQLRGPRGHDRASIPVICDHRSRPAGIDGRRLPRGSPRSRPCRSTS